MDVTLEISIFDPPLVKPKCVSGVADFFSFQLFVYNFQLFVYNFQINPPPLKHILVFTTYGLGSIIMALQPFEIATFDLGHPVGSRFT